MGRLGNQPAFGLASTDRQARESAVQSVSDLLSSVKRFHDAQGRHVVHAVELHGAPRPAAASQGALAESLREISAWDWDGVDLVLEHSDAWSDAHTPEKGFLSLESEIEAIVASGTAVGLSLNWGRSVIEGRSPAAATSHAARAARSGLLRGFIASGASDTDGETSRAWIDAHHGFQSAEAHPYGDSASLLTEERLAEALRAAGELQWCGVKVGWPASRAGTVTERVTMIRQALAGLQRAMQCRS